MAPAGPSSGFRGRSLDKFLSLAADATRGACSGPSLGSARGAEGTSLCIKTPERRLSDDSLPVSRSRPFEGRLGVADPPLIDYIAELLVRFVRSDDMYAVRSVRGQRLMAVTDMLAEAQHREGPARQQVHRHIGDFTLFWTGVYPEVADCIRRGSKDALIDYQQQGKRAYWIASTIPVEKGNADARRAQAVE